MFKLEKFLLIKALTGLFFFPLMSMGQQRWEQVDSLFGELPESMHVYRSTLPLDGKAFVGYYVEAMLKDKGLEFTTDTTFNRRLTPRGFYEKNQNPVVVVNGTFFSFETNRNLNLVIRRGKLLSRNLTTVHPKGKDSAKYLHQLNSAIGISKKAEADVAWLLTDSSAAYAYASQVPVKPMINDSPKARQKSMNRFADISLEKWKMKTAIGGGPVLLQAGNVMISNNEERKFAGKAVDDLHPRTAMGYTADGRLIIMVVQGRMPAIAEGASLKQLANLLKETGCVEALNLDGGGSSCMLVNGKETIKPSDKNGQRPVPAVFIVNRRY